MRSHDISIRLARVVCGAAALVAVGCGGKDVVVQNEGRLCVFPASSVGQNGLVGTDRTPLQYVAGEPLQLSVVFNVCLSSSCSTNRQASCMVAKSGNTFAVTARGSYHQDTSGACTDDCGVLNPTCATPPVSEGTFTFEYAGGSVDLVVPSTVVPPCVGMAFGS